MGEGHHTDHVVGPLGLEGDLGDDSPAGRVNPVPNIGLAEVSQVVARLCHSSRVGFYPPQDTR